MVLGLDNDDVAVVELAERPTTGASRAAIRRARAARIRRRRRRTVVFVVLGTWVGLVGWSFSATLAASTRANQAVALLAADGLANSDEADLRSVAADLETAKSRLNDPWVKPLEFVPLLGRQIRAAKTIDDSALLAIDAGADAIVVLDRARASGSQTELLDLARTELSIARAKLAATVLPSSALLVPQLVDASERLGEQLVEIDGELARFEAVADAFGSLVSTNGRYLIAAANTSEMGAGTGMMLSLGTLEISNGAINVGEIKSIGTLTGRPSGVSVPQELRDRWFSLDPGHLFQYVSHLTPRADEAGRVIVEMYDSIAEGTVDGVLIVNPVALQILLEGGGASEVEIGDETYPVDVVGRFFGRLQYQLYEDSEERRGLLAPLAARAFASVFADVSDPQRLVDSIYRAVDGRHLMAWSRDPLQQARWEALGMDGGLRADSLLVAALNSGGNKLDGLLEIAVDLSWSQVGGATTVVAHIDVHNTATGGEVDYVAGGGRRGNDAGEYAGYLTVNLPAGATRAEMTGDSETNAAGPDGPTHQLVHILSLNPGAKAQYVLEFDLPGVFETLTVEPSGRLPAISWTVNGQTSPDLRTTFALAALEE